MPYNEPDETAGHARSNGERISSCYDEYETARRCLLTRMRQLIIKDLDTRLGSEAYLSIMDRDFSSWRQVNQYSQGAGR